MVQCVEYSYANLLLFALMINALFYAFGKQEDLRSRVKRQLPKKDLLVQTRGISTFGRLGRHFCFEKRECDSVPALMI